MVHHPKYPLFTRDLNLRVKVTQKTSQYPLHHVIYASTKFEDAMNTSLGEDTFSRQYINWLLPLGVKFIWSFAQYPLHHVTYAPAKLDVAMSNILGGDAFTRE